MIFIAFFAECRKNSIFINIEFSIMRFGSLKPQDLVVALKLAVRQGKIYTYASISSEVGLAVAGVHASVRMLIHARLATGSLRDGLEVNRTALQELLIYGVPYFFPPSIGGLTRGIATASAVFEIASELITRQEVYVWPDPHGTMRGTSIQPLHSCALIASAHDEILHRVLMCIDVLRVEGARERALAIEILRRDLA